MTLLSSRRYRLFHHLRNRQRLEVDYIVIDRCINPIFAPVIFQSVYQIFFCHTQMFRNFILVLAPSFIRCHNPAQADPEVIAVSSGAELLLSVGSDGLIQNVSGRGVVVAKLFCQNAGFFCLSGDITSNCNGSYPVLSK